jgi:hypothetical protein
MKMPKACWTVIAALALGAVISPASAQLLGTTVTGSLKFGANPTNFFDPANGGVPPGFSNTASPTVVIAEPAVEFGYQDGANRDTANFTNTQLIVTDDVFSSASNWTMQFTDNAFTSIVEVVDSFPTGGVTAVLVGNQITLTWAGTFTPGSFRAVYDVSAAAAVPEPGSLALLVGSGVVGLLKLRRRK